MNEMKKKRKAGNMKRNERDERKKDNLKKQKMWSTKWRPRHAEDDLITTLGSSISQINTVANVFGCLSILF